jgi:translation initiation factor 1
MVSEHRTVWSSEDGGRIRYCARCGARLESCRCRSTSTQLAQTGQHAPRDGIVRLARAKAGRGGKLVTVISGLPGDQADLEALASELKKHCGVGGTVRDGMIELQGEQREKLLPKLRALGFQVKIAGG